MKCDWKGVFPAATTQFAADGAVDMKATAEGLEMMLAAGVDGFVMLGSVGENTVLDAAEKRAVVKLAKEVVRGRVPVLSGVSEITTSAACAYAQDCAAIGIDGLMVLPAMIYKADAREGIAHFRAVARASSLPIMIYNNPPAYNLDLRPEHLAELADEPTLVCIKESAGNSRRFTDIKNLLGDRYVLFCGLDDLAFEAATLGAVGWVAGFAGVFPKETVALWKLLAAGNYAEALPVYRWFTPLLHLDDHPKLVQYIKFAQSLTGHGSETTRPPRLALVGEERARIEGLVRQALATRPNL
ncbi:MAG: dihydrodipicolinate synthase family protein [Thalassobaculales bacterium]